MKHRLIIAIDGPAGAGKSTVARRLAEKLGFIYIDTGAMYRAVALWALRMNVGLNDMYRLEKLAAEARIEFAAGTSKTFLNGEDVTEAIREPEVGSAASKVSTIPGLRRALVEQQRQMGAVGNVVMEGRDIGSIVFPDARIKIFLDAKPAIRAARRAQELEQRGEPVPQNVVETQMRDRDERDRNRSEAPLLQAPDAVYIDSSGLSINQVEESILKLIRERTSNGKEVVR